MTRRAQDILLPGLLLVSAALAVGAATPVPLIDLEAEGIADRLKPSGEQVTYEQTAGGLSVRISAGDAGYPGISIAPDGDAWDLSAFGHIEARIANTGDEAIRVNLRVDNAGDWRANPWNCESVSIKPGQSGAVKVIFGYQYGMKPGFKLNPAAVVNVLLFTGKAKQPGNFVVESLTAAGEAGEKPPVNPDDVRIKPVDGFLLGGSDIKIDLAKQVSTDDGVIVEVVTVAGQEKLRIACSGGSDSHRISVRPPMGAWNLGHSTEVQVKLTNTGATPIAPSIQLFSSKRDGTDVIVLDAPLAPGSECEMTIPYAPAKPWEGPHHDIDKAHSKDKVPGTGTDFSSHRTDEIRIVARHSGDVSLTVDSIKAAVSTVETPEWLGKRPPVEGDWTVTFGEEFDGDSVDLEKWNVYGPNWWGVSKLTHWSKDNVIVADGVAKMHFEKKTGFHNDDPETKHESPYAGGYLCTYGKWTQRYGYFEARMKLPVATGVWPAFWMMPDRGVDVGEQWQRASTGDSGMEFDIMEHLTSWGPYRYTIAMHWDGYKADHRATGARVYLHPDAEGYITSGLLWTPGVAVFYCQGKEVARWENNRISSVPSNFLFTMPVGGWENEKHPVDEELPVDFVIDYVRAWQRDDLAGE